MFTSVLLIAAAVFLAELGDKTQLVCMAFVARFGPWKVLAGASAAALLNAGLAVVVGEGLTRVVPISTLQIIAGIGFLGFGFWSLRGGEGENDCPEVTGRRQSPFWTVFIAFFVAELGDKTQLVTLGLTAQQDAPLVTMLGASLGLITAQALGIFMSAWIAKHIPPRAVKVGAAVMFFAFGSVSLYQNLPMLTANRAYLTLYVVFLTAAFAVLVRKKSPQH